jgi:hypothetical protein
MEDEQNGVGIPELHGDSYTLIVSISQSTCMQMCGQAGQSRPRLMADQPFRRRWHPQIASWIDYIRSRCMMPIRQLLISYGIIMYNIDPSSRQPHRLLLRVLPPEKGGHRPPR